MASGYTDKISKGMLFEDFLLGCAKAFGACISLRDDPLSKEIPQEFKPSNHYRDYAISTQAEIKQLKKMTLKEATKQGKKKYDSDTNYIREANKKDKFLKDRYLEMLNKVKLWNPPTSDHTNLKEFMITQINQSIEFDCDIRRRKLFEVEFLCGEQWFNMKMKMLLESLDYNIKEWEKEKQRCKERTKWVKDLRDSLI